MADFLYSGAIVLKVNRFRRLPDERGGTLRRMLGGQLRGTAIWTARAWEADIFCETDAEANNVHGIANPFSDASFAGDGLGGTVTVRAEVTADEYAQTEEGWYRVVTLSLREQLS